MKDRNIVKIVKNDMKVVINCFPNGNAEVEKGESIAIDHFGMSKFDKKDFFRYLDSQKYIGNYESIYFGYEQCMDGLEKTYEQLTAGANHG